MNSTLYVRLLKHARLTNATRKTDAANEPIMIASLDPFGYRGEEEEDVGSRFVT